MRTRLVPAVLLATLPIALGAGAQPVPKPVDPHDWHDERYQRPAPAQPGTPHHQHHGHGASQPGHHPHTTQPASQQSETTHQHGQTAAPSGGQEHGMPAGWKFTLPKGDAGRGRDAFTKLECFKCHEVKGQTFPGMREAASVGPELSGMAAHHDAEFFAEAIMNPGAVVDEPQWRGPDGTSKMPSFNESITVQELVDLVAFLKSLAPPAASTSTEHKH